MLYAVTHDVQCGVDTSVFFFSFFKFLISQLLTKVFTGDSSSRIPEIFDNLSSRSLTKERVREVVLEEERENICEILISIVKLWPIICSSSLTRTSLNI